jgi:hypothetical protein
VSDGRALLLKAGATALTLGATLVSAVYVTAHLKNSGAPLQPAVLSSSEAAALGLPGGGTLTLGPSVSPTDSPPVTSTYAS